MIMIPSSLLYVSCLCYYRQTFVYYLSSAGTCIGLSGVVSLPQTKRFKGHISDIRAESTLHDGLVNMSPWTHTEARVLLQN